MEYLIGGVAYVSGGQSPEKSSLSGSTVFV